MKIKFLGHSSFLFEINRKVFVLDPFISGNSLAKSINISEIFADYILVTHAHNDHILDVEEIAKNNSSKIISNFEIANYFGKKGLQTIALNHGGKIILDENIQIKFVNAIHSSNFSDGNNGGNPGGFIISDLKNNKNIYVSGDTAVHFDMKIIPLQFKLDLAILPIGDVFTMGTQDAILASDFVECDKIIGCHFDTFEPIIIDKDFAKNSFAEKNKELILLAIGEELEI